MFKPIIQIIIFFLIISPVCADLTPMQFWGYNMYTTESKSISMIKEEVIISEVGHEIEKSLGDKTRFNINATFYMFNNNPHTQRIIVGFPIGPDLLIKDFRRGKENKMSNIQEPIWDIYYFSVKANEKKINNIKKLSQINGYGWVHDFAPGKSKVEVNYDIYASELYASNLQNIVYIMHSGAPWEGKIQEAKIVLEFSRKVDKEMLLHVSPSNYKIVDNKIAWHFKDIEPTGADDIQVKFMPRRMYETYQKVKAEYEQDKTNVTNRIKRIKSLLGIEIGRDRAHYLEGFIKEIDTHKFEKEILSNLKGADWDFIHRSYKKDGDIYKLALSETDRKFGEKKRKIKKIICQTDFNFQFPIFDYFLEAEKLILETLKQNPKNPVLWDIYLKNSHKMKIGINYRYMYYASEYRYEKPKILGKLIKEAYKNCPDDEIIQCWYGLLNKNFRKLPHNPGIFVIQVAKVIRMENVCLKGIDIDTGFLEDRFKAREIKQILKCYQKVNPDSEIVEYYPGNKFKKVINYTWDLILKKSFTKKAEKQAIKILEKHGFFDYYFTDKIWNFGTF